MAKNKTVDVPPDPTAVGPACEAIAHLVTALNNVALIRHRLLPEPKVEQRAWPPTTDSLASILSQCNEMAAQLEGETAGIVECM